MLALEEQRTLVAQLDERYLVHTLVDLAQVPTDVPRGPVVFMELDDAKLVHEIRGKAVHSSSPQLGLSAIDGAHEVVNRLKQVPLAGAHPLLGGRHAIVYQMLFEPLAPHTLPEVAHLRIDRRLLPGDDPEQAVADVREAIGELSPYQVRVERGPYMLPALVDPAHPGVLALEAAHRQVRGATIETYYGQGAFDAGGPCAAGVPAVMYGVGGGASVLGDDFVPLSHLIDEARVVTHTILSLLG